jgi:putative ABC transport system permease protein
MTMRGLFHRLLRALTDRALADSIAGDLDELRHRRASRSRLIAALWFWRDAAGILLHAAMTRVRDTLGGRRAWRGRPGRAAGDLRHAVRALRAAPWYAATVIGVMALGIALSATVFAVVDGVLFKPLPYPDADRLVAIQPGFTDPTVSGRPPVSANELAAWQAQLPDVRFTGISLSPTTGFEGPNEGPLGGAIVHPTFFDVLGVRPLIGGFAPEDFQHAGGPVPAIISYDLWQRRFGGDPSALGQTLGGAGGMVVRVAGVMPRDFVAPGRFGARVLLPVSPAGRNPAQRQYDAIVRLPAGLEPIVFQERFEAVLRRLAEGQASPGGRRFLGPFDRATIVPLADAMTQSSAPLFRGLFAAVLALVLLACLNVSGLMAARSLDRARDLALRRAIGARSTDIVRLQVMEHAVLLACGAALGVAIATPLLRITVSLLPHELNLLKTPALDLRVMMFTGLALTASVALSSIWPVRRALHASAWSLANATGAATPRARSAGRIVVIALQTAGAMLLVVAGGLLVGSLLRVWSNDPGMATQDLIIVDLQITPDGPSSFGEPSPGVAGRLDRFLDEVRALPGVRAAGGSDVLMLARGWREVVAFRHVDRDGPPAISGHGVPVTPGFFEAAGLRLVEGRLPTDQELAAGAPVAVVARSFASAPWPGASAVGSLLQTSVGQRQLPPHIIVGVVDDVRFGAWDMDPEAAVYAPYATLNFTSGPVVFVRTAGASATVMREVLRLAERETPALHVRRAATAGTLLADTVRPRRLRSWLFGSFAAASLVLVGVGLFGLAAMGLARRTREIGVRLALGATRERLVRGLVIEQTAPVVAGLTIGGLIAAWAVTFLQAYLYELTIYDARVWVTAVLVVSATALGGALIPAWRASRLDPMRALRTE